jgi:hypothetical protein
MEKHRAKSKKKANKAAASVKEKSTLLTSTSWHVVKMAHVNLDCNTAYLNSGALHHMISNCNTFSSYTESRSKIKLADGKSTFSPGFGNIYVKTKNGGNLKLECLHVPDLVGNLISIEHMFKKG